MRGLLLEGLLRPLRSLGLCASYLGGMPSPNVVIDTCVKSYNKARAGWEAFHSSGHPWSEECFAEGLWGLFRFSLWPLRWGWAPVGPASTEGAAGGEVPSPNRDRLSTASVRPAGPAPPARRWLGTPPGPRPRLAFGPAGGSGGPPYVDSFISAGRTTTPSDTSS